MSQFYNTEEFYNETLNLYDLFEPQLNKEGFTKDIASKVFKVASLPLWDAYILFLFGKKIPRGGVYVEIGSRIGGSLLLISEATKNLDIKLIGVEDFSCGRGENLEEEQRRELFKTVEFIQNIGIIEDSSDNVIEKIPTADLVFIDGDHKYTQCVKDFKNYWNKVKEGGYLIGHDFNFNKPSDTDDHSDVVRAALEVFNEYNLLKPQNSSVFVVNKEK